MSLLRMTILSFLRKKRLFPIYRNSLFFNALFVFLLPIYTSENAHTPFSLHLIQHHHTSSLSYYHHPSCLFNHHHQPHHTHTPTNTHIHASHRLYPLFQKKVMPTDIAPCHHHSFQYHHQPQDQTNIHAHQAITIFDTPIINYVQHSELRHHHPSKYIKMNKYVEPKSTNPYP